MSLSDAELRAAVDEAEKKFPEITHCTRCTRFLSKETIWRRMYSLPGIRALVVLCDACNTAVPVDSPADAEFRADLERLGTQYIPPQGRA